ncbi:MAG: anti-sigma regulatory factor [Crinalium sp.]
MLQKIYLQVNSDLNDSEKVLSWFEQLNQPPLLSPEVWWQCLTLLQEGFANIAEHAHKDLPRETPIHIEAIRSNETIEIRIWSLGPPFDLEQRLNEIPGLEENYTERGRGLKMMSIMADYLSYEKTSDERRCLVIRKNY